MAAISVRQSPQPDAAPTPRGEFRISYQALNDGRDRTEGHWDYVVIQDAEDQPCYENWLPQAGLDPGESYWACFDVPGLAAGAYRLRLTVDGGGASPTPADYPLDVG